MARTVVIGLGNPLLSDDGVGLQIVRALEPTLGERPDVDLCEDTHGGLRLMERLIGYDRAIIVDAMASGAQPGSIVELALGDMPTYHSASTHDFTLPEALAFGRIAGAALPCDEAIALVGVEAQDLYTFSESCTPAVDAAIAPAAQRVLALLM